MYSPTFARGGRWPIGRIALICYLGVLVAFIVGNGIPTDRIDQTVWILVGITAAKLGRPVSEHVRAVLDWTPLLGALMLYDHTRGIADSLGMPTRVSEMVDAEQLLFFGELPTVWLQERFYSPGVTQWWDVASGIVYMSHFVLPWALAAAFYMVSRDLWWRYIRMVLLLSFGGLVTYIIIPAAPPWYASRTGVIADDVPQIVMAGWWDMIGLGFAGRWFEVAQSGANHVAALPSLHGGFALLVSVALWPFVRHWLPRIVLVAYPIAMCLTLVYGGEHYVVDILVGWLYVAVIVGGLRLWDRRVRPAGSPDHRLLVAAEDPPRELAGALEVSGPNQEALPVDSSGQRAPDSSVDQR